MFFVDIKSGMNTLKTKRASTNEGSPVAGTEKLLPFYIRMMTKLADCERCSVFIHDSAHGKVWLKSGTGVIEREIEVPKEGSIVGDVIASGEPRIINNIDTQSGIHKQVDDKTGFITRNVLCVPIKSATRNEVSGAFQLLNKAGDEGFTSEELTLAEEIAGHLQTEVDTIFLDQETFGFTERLYSSFFMIALGLGACVIVVIAAVLALLGGLLSVA